MLRLLNLIAFTFALLKGPSCVLHASTSEVAGNLKSAIYGNGISTSYDYNARHHLRRMRTVNSAQTLLANFDYDGAGTDASAVAGSWGTQGLSKSGGRNRMDENVNGTLRSILHSYDQLNRLTKETIGGSEVVYDSAAGYAEASGYDPVGNRRNRTVAGTPITALPAQTFPNSAVGAIHRAPSDYPGGKTGDVLVVEFTVCGVACIGLNGGDIFKHSEAFSFQIATVDQAETDRYWNAIVGNGGEEHPCGWCRDKWGISWQITPQILTEAMARGGVTAKRAFEAMFPMKKIDVATIEAAIRGDGQ